MRRRSIKLGATIEAVLSDDDLRQKIRSAGIEPAFSNSPQELAAFVRSQPETRSKMIQAIGLMLD